MENTFQRKSGYSKPRFEGLKTFRAMTFEEFISIPQRGSFLVDGVRGVLEARSNCSTAKQWKTRPLDALISAKYGMYECFQIVYRNGEHDMGPMPVVEVFHYDQDAERFQQETGIEVFWSQFGGWKFGNKRDNDDVSVGYSTLDRLLEVHNGE